MLSHKGLFWHVGREKSGLQTAATLPRTYAVFRLIAEIKGLVWQCVYPWLLMMICSGFPETGKN